MITKKIWIYWHQGWDAAPSLVQQCRSSWARLNPDYEICALDQHSLYDYINLPGIDVARKDLTVQKISALGRLELLARYGGVWADATVYCARPLNEWIEEYYDARFFAFQNPGRDRLMSNWFIAAEPESLLLQRLRASFSEFYTQNYFWNQNTAVGKRLLSELTRRWSKVSTTLRWHSWFVRKVLGVYPYFIFHYTFNKLVLSEPQCKAEWEQVKPFLAEPPCRLQAFSGEPDGVERAVRDIDGRLTPVYKLNWRSDTSQPYWVAVFRHLEGHVLRNLQEAA